MSRTLGFKIQVGEKYRHSCYEKSRVALKKRTMKSGMKNDETFCAVYDIRMRNCIAKCWRCMEYMNNGIYWTM